MLGGKGLTPLTEIEQVVRDAAAVTDRAFPLDYSGTVTAREERQTQRAECFRQVLRELLRYGYRADGPYLDENRS